MKSFITPNYTFTPGASGVGTVALSGIAGFNIKYLVAIINQTRGVTIYATGSTATRYTALAGTTLTLFADTAGHSASDVLQVIYEDQTQVPVIPSMTTGGNISVTTAATGTNWTAFASQTLKQLTVSNQTGTNIEFRQGGAGVGFIVPSGAVFTFFGITNANEIGARRTDTGNTQVTITARWES